MRSRFRPGARFVAVILLGVLFLFQTGCATVHLAPSFAPGGEGGDPTEPPGGGSGSSSTGSIVGIATIAVVGGYLLYKAITNDADEEEGASTSGPSSQPKGFVLAPSLDNPEISPPSLDREVSKTRAKARGGE